MNGIWIGVAAAALHLGVARFALVGERATLGLAGDAPRPSACIDRFSSACVDAADAAQGRAVCRPGVSSDFHGSPRGLRDVDGRDATALI